MTRRVLVGGHRHGELCDAADDTHGVTLPFLDAAGFGRETYSPMPVSMVEPHRRDVTVKRWTVLCARGGDVDGRIARLLLDQDPDTVEVWQR
jgi:hypothetical protein